MKTIAYVILIFIAVICAHIFIKSTVRIAVTSSPVEEMYHRQLVVTIDSILDARFSAGCCEEVIDSDDVSIPQRLFSSQKFVDIAE